MQRIYSKEFNKRFQRLDSTTRGRIWDAIQNIPDIPFIKLHGKYVPPLFRIRVGKYRIIIEMNEHVMNIRDVDARGDVYKNL